MGDMRCRHTITTKLCKHTGTTNTAESDIEPVVLISCPISTSDTSHTTAMPVGKGRAVAEELMAPKLLKNYELMQTPEKSLEQRRDGGLKEAEGELAGRCTL